VTGGIVAVLFILVGLPLLAWWVGGRRFWGRLKPGAEASPWRDLVRAHALTTGEASQVAEAVHAGRGLEDQRLRRAAAEWAARGLGTGSSNASVRRRILTAVVVAYAVLGLGGAVVAVARGQAGHVNWFLLAYMPVLLGMGWARRRRLRRALELNTDPPTPSVGVLGE
jgi:hypothetical protein